MFQEMARVLWVREQKQLSIVFVKRRAPSKELAKRDLRATINDYATAPAAKPKMSQARSCLFSLLFIINNFGM